MSSLNSVCQRKGNFFVFNWRFLKFCICSPYENWTFFYFWHFLFWPLFRWVYLVIFSDFMSKIALEGPFFKLKGWNFLCLILGAWGMGWGGRRVRGVVFNFFYFTIYGQFFFYFLSSFDHTRSLWRFELFTMSGSALNGLWWGLNWGLIGLCISIIYQFLIFLS